MMRHLPHLGGRSEELGLQPPKSGHQLCPLILPAAVGRLSFHLDTIGEQTRLLHIHPHAIREQFVPLAAEFLDARVSSQVHHALKIEAPPSSARIIL
jgi:hypothetical protein